MDSTAQGQKELIGAGTAVCLDEYHGALRGIGHVRAESGSNL
jgi:hypothetical protein